MVESGDGGSDVKSARVLKVGTVAAAFALLALQRDGVALVLQRRPQSWLVQRDIEEGRDERIRARVSDTELRELRGGLIATYE